MADKAKELFLREFLDQIPPESGRVYEVTSTPEGKTLIKDVTAYKQDGTPWTAADAAMAINSLPPVGDLVLSFFRLAYPSGDVNAKTFPWVNFDDNLLPVKYPQLYALYGSTLSVGAPSGYFNLALLKDRFPLVSSSNFAATGGEEKHTLTTAELPKTEITLANSYGSLATTDADFSTAAASQKLVIGNPNNAWATHPFSRSFGDSKAHNNVPPYVATCAHVRAG